MTEEQIQAALKSGTMKGPKLRALLDELEAINRNKVENRILFFNAYPKQKIFFGMGARKRERLLMAGNQLGKSEAGAVETTYHLTGRYPADWEGKRFDHPVRGWAAGVTSLDVRNIQQKKLCGTPGIESEFGHGFIPKSCFSDKPSLARGVTDAYDTIFVWHETNGVRDGVSTLHFKSYEQGRTKFQGDTIDFGWADEEPEDITVYNEFLTRLSKDGMIFMTFTPLFGPTELVDRFRSGHPDRDIVTMEIDDPTITHFTPEEKEKRKAGYADYEREARSKGVPLLGSGRVFTTAEDAIRTPYFDYLPPHWKKLWGIDFGMGHPFAAVLIAWDVDNDIIYVIDCFKQANTLILQDAAGIKQRGIMVPVAWPQDGTQRDKQSGEPAAMMYKKEGLLMLHEHAQFESGSRSTEEGILEMDQRLKNGKLKVAAHLAPWFEEYRFYHRKDGKIVKVRDDLMSATRIALMMKRFAKPVALGSKKVDPKGRQQRSQASHDLDWLFD